MDGQGPMAMALSVTQEAAVRFVEQRVAGDAGLHKLKDITIFIEKPKQVVLLPADLVFHQEIAAAETCLNGTGWLCLAKQQTLSDCVSCPTPPSRTSSCSFARERD